jgi:flagellar assembly protein FliH
MTAHAQKTPFSFDTVFSEDGEVVRAPQRQRPKTSYSPEEVEIIRAECLEQGARDARAAADAAVAQALRRAEEGAQNLHAALDREVARLRAESAALAVAAARRVAGVALARFPLDEIEHAVADAMHQLHAEPRLIVRVPAALAEEVRKRMPQWSQADGYAGKVVVMGDGALTGSDSRIEWKDGGVERDVERAFAAMEAEIARWCAVERTQDAQTGA